MRKLILPFASFAALALVTSLVGCGGGGSDTGGAQPATPKPSNGDKGTNPPAATHPDSNRVTWQQDPSFAKCHNDVKTGKDLVAGVTAMAQGCAGLMKQHQVGATVQDSFANLDKAHPIPLHAESGHCYRVYGLSEDSLQDLDIAVIDSAGHSCGEDGSDSPDSVVLEDGQICFTATDDVVVNVAAGNGNGKYAVQIWGN